MKELWGILLGFFPWIMFAAVSGPSLPRLNLALALSLAAVLALGYRQLRRGFFLTWGSLLFFGLSLLAIGGLKILWPARHMDLLARAALALIAWASILAGRPFTMQYARETVPEAYWHTPSFIRASYVIAMVWGVIFVLATGACLAQPYLPLRAPAYQLFSVGIMVSGVAFTRWYSARVRKARQGRNDGS